MATTATVAPTKRWWKLQEFVAHGQSVNCLALGQKSGRVMVTGGDDKKVNLWAIGKPSCIMSLTGHTTPVECVKFGVLDDMVCAGSISGALKIWDLEAAKILRTLTGHKSNVKCLDFHPYGDFLASGSNDNMIKLWDIRRKGCVYTYKGHNKTVNSVIFSPDGRWIASGGQDGTVKLWDLPAGKMLTEFEGHSGPVTDVQYHPNEFLLASGSSDRTVKFWDLESFQMVSSVDSEASVRSLLFNGDGDCLFCGSQDSLKVMGWEPARTYDHLVMGWGKVQDMVTSQQQQLIAGSFSMTNVSVYVVDLKRVQPFWVPPTNKTNQSRQISNNSFTPGNTSHMRRSFSKSQSPKDCVEMKMIEDPDVSSAPEVDPGDDKDSFAEIKQDSDYNEIFHPRKQLVRTPEPPEDLYPSCAAITRVSGSLESLNIKKNTNNNMHHHSSLLSVNHLDQPTKVVLPGGQGTVTISSGLPPAIQQSIENLKLQQQLQRTTSQGISSSSLLNATYTKQTNDLSSRTVTVNPTVNAQLTNAVKPMEKAKVNVRQQHQTTMESTTTLTQSSQSAISIVRPVISEPRQPLHQQQQQQHFQQQHQQYSSMQHSTTSYESNNFSDFVPQQREQPAGLDLDEFLPRHLQESLRFGGGPHLQMSENEAICGIVQGHGSMVAVLTHRRKQLQIILAQWTTKDNKSALESAIQMNNLSVLTDILSVITLRPSLWTLDFCYVLLPTIYDLLQSKYEAYMLAGCSSLKLILKNFASVIKTNITAPPGVGVDITREERYDKCMSCFKQLLSIRAFLLKRQTLQGKLGQSFRELHILMQGLE